MNLFIQTCRAKGYLSKAGIVALLVTLLSISQLALAAPSEQGAVRSSRLQQLQTDLLTHPERGTEMITLILEGHSQQQDLAGAINSAGVKIERQIRNLHQVRIPAAKLKAFLDKMPQGTSARLPYPHTTNTVISQGVNLTGAADMQNLSFDGTGVKIGIIDLGFASLSTSQAANELPPTGAGLNIIDYSGTGTGGINHGTNVAEIVHDMAPGAELYLAKISTDLELEIAVNDMIASGVQVINHSVGWYAAAFYDGTGPICDITNTAAVNGLIWANSAGNARQQHYLGNFTDTDGSLAHEFATGQNYNTINVTSGYTYTLVLNWDAYPSTTVDYDLYLYNGDPAAGGNIVAASTNAQSGRGALKFPTPYEAISYTATTTGTFYIVATKKDSATANLPLSLFTLLGSLGTQTKSSSLTQPADCALVLTVGATNLSDLAEYFSSEGPTVDGRNKPEISGPDRNVTSLSASFAGTSSSSPHVAGAVAQLIQQNPGLNKTQIQNLLTSTSHDVNTAGFDYRTGYGRFSLDADSDSINHDDDNCLLNYNPYQFDNDLDASGDICDDDDDNDSLSDVFENSIGSNPFLWDTDGDGLS
ncbi:MAG: S8 family serine peptidase, partial [Gammaproteobacteria bacterium]|nr:S8 family serine peptidase [Gammaproteobacteria bacterium]